MEGGFARLLLAKAAVGALCFFNSPPASQRRLVYDIGMQNCKECGFRKKGKRSLLQLIKKSNSSLNGKFQQQFYSFLKTFKKFFLLKKFWAIIFLLFLGLGVFNVFSKGKQL